MRPWDVRKQVMERQLDSIREKIIGRHKKCKGTGFIEVTTRDEVSGVAHRMAKACSCKRKYELVSIFTYSNLPYRSLLNQQIYGRIVIDAVSEEKIEIRKEIVWPYIKNITKAASNPFGFLFLGKNGVGKTFIGLKILYYGVVNGFTVHNIELVDLLKLSRKTFNNDKEAELLLEEIGNVDILMIDEVGNESKRSPYVISELKSLYKKRVTAKKPTILITNYSYPNFRKIYGKSIDNMVRSYSRILDFSLAADVRTTKCNKEMQTFFKEIKRK